MPEGDGMDESVVAGETLVELVKESEVAIVFRARDLKVSRTEPGKGMGRTSPSIVCLRRRIDKRRMPLLNFSYDDFLEDVEVMEGAVEAIEPVVNDDVVVGCLSSLELSDVRHVDSEIR